jgi:2-keto-4-pentenoate hydratase
MEIIDSRIADWDIGLLDTIADNASCGAIVLGREPLDVDAGNTAGVTAGILVNGSIVASGRGEAVLGDPIAPLVWLANQLGRRGVTLEAGEVILTGSFCRAAPVAAGDHVVADFGTHGSISVSFEGVAP